jgi:hypothetical protein
MRQIVRNGSGIWMKSFVKIRGQTHYLWRAVDHEGEVLESLRYEDPRQGFCIEIP